MSIEAGGKVGRATCELVLLRQRKFAFQTPAITKSVAQPDRAPLMSLELSSTDTNEPIPGRALAFMFRALYLELITRATHSIPRVQPVQLMPARCAPTSRPAM
jgi:hypothetical protein